MEKIEVERTVALFVSCGVHIVLECEQDGEAPSWAKGYARVSEPVTMTFTPRSKGEIVAAQVAAVDAEINEARDRFAAKLAELQERRSNLLALTGPES